MKKLFFCLFFFSITLQMIIAQKATPLVKGKILNGDSVKADLVILEKALTEIHPGIYRYNSKADIQKEFESLRGKIGATISEADFMKSLAQSITKIKCGHTYVNPWNMKKAIRARLFSEAIYFPLGFQIIDGDFFVTHNASAEKDIQKGAAILSINGHTIEEIYDSLSTIARSDGNNYAPSANYLSVQNFTVRNWEAFDLYFPLFFPLTESNFTVEYKNYKGSPQKVQIKALSKAERAQKMKAKYGDQVLKKERWDLSFPEEGVAIMKLGTFAIWNWKDFDHKAWFAESFQSIKDKNIETLIVDIRGNGGGLGEPRDELVKYLIKKELPCKNDNKVLIRTTKIDPSLIPFIDTWNKAILEGVQAAYYTKFEKDWYALKESLDCTTLYPKDLAFDGSTYLFGGADNVSATATLLQMADTENFGTFIGSTCGGNMQGINGGEYAFFYMPYSQMEVDIPLKFFYKGANQPDQGLEPTVKIHYSQKDIAEDKDPYLEYVLKNK